MGLTARRLALHLLLAVYQEWSRGMETPFGVHPTALISPEAELGPHVVIGPYAVLEGKVILGPDCIVGAQALLCGPLTMGRGNIIHARAVLGEQPQHLKYNGEPTSLEIGDDNTFGEQVTIHRGTIHSMATRIKNHNTFMAHSHVGHDCQIGNHCLLDAGALVGGHCIIEDQVHLARNSALHQFARVGRLAKLAACSISTKDIPPFVYQEGFDSVAGVNHAGMRRASVDADRIHAVRRAFRILFCEGLPLPTALNRLEWELGAVDLVQEMLAFLRQCHKGINPMRDDSFSREKKRGPAVHALPGTPDSSP
jgi:UDP-N-acetylglucosamine acyltransferase